MMLSARQMSLRGGVRAGVAPIQQYCGRPRRGQGALGRHDKSQKRDLLQPSSRRGLNCVSGAAQNSIHEMKIAEAIGIAFGNSNRLDNVGLHDVPQQEVRHHRRTTVSQATQNFRPKIRNSILRRNSSEQFYALERAL